MKPSSIISAALPKEATCGGVADEENTLAQVAVTHTHERIHTVLGVILLNSLLQRSDQIFFETTQSFTFSSRIITGL